MLEDRDQQDLLEEARASALRTMLASSQEKEALAWVARAAGTMGFEDLLQSALGLRKTFLAFDARRFSAALRPSLCLDADATLAGVESAIVGGPELGAQRAAWAKDLARGKPRTRKWPKFCSTRMRGETRASKSTACSRPFSPRTGSGPPLKRSPTLATKDLAKAAPQLEVDLCVEQDRLEALRDIWRAAATLERTQRLFAVVKPI